MKHTEDHIFAHHDVITHKNTLIVWQLILQYSFFHYFFVFPQQVPAMNIHQHVASVDGMQ